MKAPAARQPGSLNNVTAAETRMISVITGNIVDLVGGGAQAELYTRVRQSMLSVYGNPDRSDCYISAPDILALERLAGEPLLTRWLANAQGWDLARVDGPRASGAVGHGDLARLVAECSGAVTALCDALGNPDITRTERRRILRELAELRQAIAMIEAKLEGR